MSVRVSALNAKLDKCRRDMQEQQRKHEQALRELRQWYTAELERLNREKDAAIAQMYWTLREEDRQIAETAIQRVRDAANQQLLEIQQENERYRRVCEELNARMIRENETMKQTLEEYLQKKQQDSTVQKEFAENLIDIADQVRLDLSELPLEHFSGEEYQHYCALLEDARTNLQNKMYQAAAAVASNARALLQGLAANLNVKIEEWNRYFSQWAGMCMGASEALNDATQLKQSSCLGQFLLTPVEWDYWSKGSYSELRREMDQHLQTIATAQELGIRKYLKREDALKTQDLRNLIHTAYGYAPRVGVIATTVAAEFRFSDERFDVGGKILKMMEENCYWPVEDPDFPPPDGVTARKAWYRRYYDELNPDDPIISYEEETVDSLQYYELKLTYRGRDQIIIRIVPYRENDITVRNDFILAVELAGAPDADILRDLQNANADRVEALLASIFKQPRSVQRLDPTQMSNQTFLLQRGTKPRSTQQQALIKAASTEPY